MKVFAALSASVIAQFPQDFSAPPAAPAVEVSGAGINLGSFGFGAPPSAFSATVDVGPPAAAVDPNIDPATGLRYAVFDPNPGTTTSTTTTTTTLIPIDGSYCWKCDQSSFIDCAALGDFQQCTVGDGDCCWLEVREVRDKLKQLCTGCKDSVACEATKAENGRFFEPHLLIRNQCRPEHGKRFNWRRFGNHQSVCRQCFEKCSRSNEGSAQYCFGGIHQTAGMVTNGVSTRIDEVTNDDTNANTFKTRAVFDSDTGKWTLGVPTLAVFDNDSGGTINDGAAISAMIGNKQFFGENILSTNAFFSGNFPGANFVPNSGSERQTIGEMTYWKILNQPLTWWMSASTFADSLLNTKKSEQTVLYNAFTGDVLSDGSARP